MSKIDDNVNRVLEQLIKLTFNLNYNLPVNLSATPIIKTDILPKNNTTKVDQILPYYEYCPFEYVNNGFYVKCNKVSNL